MSAVTSKLNDYFRFHTVVYTTCISVKVLTSQKWSKIVTVLEDSYCRYSVRSCYCRPQMGSGVWPIELHYFQWPWVSFNATHLLHILKCIFFHTIVRQLT